jgi:citrate lyase subunit beta/citryl-CoA lyase
VAEGFAGKPGHCPHCGKLERFQAHRGGLNPSAGRNQSMDFFAELLGCRIATANCCERICDTGSLVRLNIVALAHSAQYSYLFVPATRLDRVEKALAMAADVVIVDLEDGVGSADKSRARDALAELRPSRKLHVRINSWLSEDGEADALMVSKAEWVNGIVLPMVESVNDVDRLMRFIVTDIPIIALIETAKGVLGAPEIAASGVSRLAFGSADYAADIATTPSDDLYFFPRVQLVLSSAASQLPPPIDGPTLVVGDSNRVAKDSQAARKVGMGAKFCIHPTQIETINASFSASDDERLWAISIVESAATFGDGVIVVDGEMVDAPVVARAKRVLGL